MKIIGTTAKGKKVQVNQAELVREYKRAYQDLKPKTLKTILALREKFIKRGMVV